MTRLSSTVRTQEERLSIPADSRDEDLHVRDNRAAWRVPTSFCNRKHPRHLSCTNSRVTVARDPRGHCTRFG